MVERYKKLETKENQGGGISNLVDKTRKELLQSLLGSTMGLYLFEGKDDLGIYSLGIFKKGKEIVLRISVLKNFKIPSGSKYEPIKELIVTNDIDDELGPWYTDANVLDALNWNRKEGLFLFSLIKEFYMDTNELLIQGPYQQVEYYLIYLKPSEKEYKLFKIADYGDFYKIGEGLYFISGRTSYLIDLRDFLKKGGKNNIKIKKLDRAYKVKDGVVFIKKEKEDDIVGDLVFLTNEKEEVLDRGVIFDTLRYIKMGNRMIIKYRKMLRGIFEMGKSPEEEYEKFFDI